MFNRVTLVGELVGTFRKSEKATRFTLKTSDSKGEERHTVTCVGNLAQKVEDFAEGDRLFVEGKLQSNESGGVRASIVFCHTAFKV